MVLVMHRVYGTVFNSFLFSLFLFLIESKYYDVFVGGTLSYDHIVACLYCYRGQSGAGATMQTFFVSQDWFHKILTWMMLI